MTAVRDKVVLDGVLSVLSSNSEHIWQQNCNSKHVTASGLQCLEHRGKKGERQGSGSLPCSSMNTRGFKSAQHHCPPGATWELLAVLQRAVGSSPVQALLRRRGPHALLAVELREPAPVLLDARILSDQQRLKQVLFVIPDGYISLKLGREGWWGNWMSSFVHAAGTLDLFFSISSQWLVWDYF